MSFNSTVGPADDLYKDHRQHRPSFMAEDMPFFSFRRSADEEYQEERRRERLRQAQQNRQTELKESLEKAAAHRQAQQQLGVYCLIHLEQYLTAITEKFLAEEKKEQDAKKKKVKAETNRSAAAKSAQDSKQRRQTLRSAVFAAARSGDSAKVKKGIWEDQVDAAGGEIAPGCEKLVQKKPQDSSETLMHIAVQRDDKDLLEWLDSHSELTTLLSHHWQADHKPARC